MAVVRGTVKGRAFHVKRTGAGPWTPALGACAAHVRGRPGAANRSDDSDHDVEPGAEGARQSRELGVLLRVREGTRHGPHGLWMATGAW